MIVQFVTSRFGVRIKTLIHRFPWADRHLRRLYALVIDQSLPGGQPFLGDADQDESRRIDLGGRFCEAPFRQFDLYETGNVHLCCATWLPTPIGNLADQGVEEVWNSTQAKDIRASIFDGSFRFCNHRLCPRIQGNTLPTLRQAEQDPEVGHYVRERRVDLDGGPTLVNLCNDTSCNLQCPSCRTKLINFSSGVEYESRKQLQDRLTNFLFSAPSDRSFTVSVTGSGDPFASRMFRELLYELNGADFPNMKIHLQTNGVLLTRSAWDRMSKIHKNLACVLVSFDAATEPTYSIVRRGGRWETLLENAGFLAQRRGTGELAFLRFDFVVQKDNFREMPDFVRLGKRFGVDQVSFSLLVDWGTWPTRTYREKSIARGDNPQFEEFIQVLRDPVFGDPIVALGNLSQYRDRASSVAV